MKTSFTLAGWDARLRFVAFQAGTLSVALTALFVWPILGKIVSPTQIGVLSGALAVSSICAPVLTLALHLSLANRLSFDARRAGGMDGKVASHWAAGLMLVGLTLLIVPSQVGQWPIVAALCFSSASALIVTGTARGLNRPFMFAFYTVLVQVGGLLGLGLGLALGSLRLGALLFALLVATGLVLQVRLVGLPSRKASWTGSVDMLKQSIRLVPHVVLAVILLMLMRLLVEIEDGPRVLGSFQFAALLIGGSTTIAASLDAHWSIRAQSEPDPSAIGRTLTVQQRRIQGLLLLVTVFVLIFCTFGLHYWLPAGYPENEIRLAVILALPTGALQAYADGFSAFAIYRSAYGTVSLSTVIGVAVAAVLGILVIRAWGWPFVGLAVTAGALFRVGFMVRAARRLGLVSILGRESTLLVAAQLIVAAVVSIGMQSA